MSSKIIQIAAGLELAPVPNSSPATVIYTNNPGSIVVIDKITITNRQATQGARASRVSAWLLHNEDPVVDAPTDDIGAVYYNVPVWRDVFLSPSLVGQLLMDNANDVAQTLYLRTNRQPVTVYISGREIIKEP